MNLETILLFFTLFFSTFILEDATVYWAVVLIEEGKVSYYVALVSVSLGIYAGDVLLYLFGRYGTKIKFIGKWLEKLFGHADNTYWFQKINQLLVHNNFVYVFFSRFMPGFRMPIYVLSGRNKFSFVQFSIITFIMAFVWVSTIFSGVQLSFHFLEETTRLPQYVLYIILFIVFLAILKVMEYVREPYRFRVLYYKLQSFMRWEFWPAFIFYAPLTLRIIYLVFKKRVFITSLTAANPCFKYGGLSFDSKTEMLEAFKKYGKYIAKADLVKVGDHPDFEELKFPIIAKPDKGHRGDSVNLIHNKAELHRYAKNLKRPYILQEYIDYPFELGVFWLRLPWEKNGRVFSVTRKILPYAEGDGKSSLLKLIFNDKRARLMAGVYIENNLPKIKHAPAKGERVRLAIAANHCKGAIFEDGKGDISGATEKLIEKICLSIPGFYFGRFDIKFKNRNAFSNGKDFKILEINGAESEATHIYDSRNSLAYAYKILFEQWEVLFDIARYNIKNGVKPVPYISGLVMYLRFFLTKT